MNPNGQFLSLLPNALSVPLPPLPISCALLTPQSPPAKIKPPYARRSPTGGLATVLLLALAAFLSLSEFRAWYAGAASQHFSVERGVGHGLQINLDAVVAMPCADLHVNVQDAAGDRILAGDVFQRDATSWAQWADPRRVKVHHERNRRERGAREAEERRETRARHVVEAVRRHGGEARGQRRFPRTPKLRHGMREDACRIYGSIEGNKVQGDFHITARGHGYRDWGQHVDHSSTFLLSFPPFSSPQDWLETGR